MEPELEERYVLERDIQLTRADLQDAIDAVRSISEDLAMLEAAWRLRWGDS